MRKTSSQRRRARQQNIWAGLLLVASCAMIGFIFSPWYMPVAKAVLLPLHPISKAQAKAEHYSDDDMHKLMTDLCARAAHEAPHKEAGDWACTVKE